jgi:hypothetical protein
MIGLDRNKQISPIVLGMDHIKHILELEARGRGFGLTARQLYKRAGVPASSMCRWKQGRSSPGIVRFRDAIGKINKVLADLATEKAMAA